MHRAKQTIRALLILKQQGVDVGHQSFSIGVGSFTVKRRGIATYDSCEVAVLFFYPGNKLIHRNKTVVTIPVIL